MGGVDARWKWAAKYYATALDEVLKVEDRRRQMVNEGVNTELLASLKETRDAAAYLIRICAEAGLADRLTDHCFDGFGVRATAAIARAEAGAATMDEDEIEAWQLVDDSPYSWTWELSGPLLSDEQRWRCDVLGIIGGDVTAYGPTRADAIFAAAGKAMTLDGVTLDGWPPKRR